MIDSHALFIIWLAFTILVICAVVPFVIWAIRSGQFSNFDYAARLALKSRIIEKHEEKKMKEEKENVPA